MVTRCFSPPDIAGIERADLSAVEPHVAGGRLQTVETPEECGLARARRADQDERIASLDPDRHVLEDRDRRVVGGSRVGEREVLDLEERIAQRGRGGHGGVSVTLVLADRRQNYPDDDARRNDERRGDAAQPEAPFGARLGQGVAEGRAEGARQDVRGPEDHALLDRREEVRRRDEREQAREDERATLESEARARRHEVAECGAERARRPRWAAWQCARTSRARASSKGRRRPSHRASSQAHSLKRRTKRRPAIGPEARARRWSDGGKRDTLRSG